MSMLKLFGFTAEEERALRRKVYKEDIKEPDEDSEELGVEEKVGQLAHARTQVDTIWVVCVTVLEEFLNFLPSLLSLLKQHWGKTSRLPKVVLWVPQGKTPLAFEQWGERFYAQLQEESEEDC